LVEVTDAVVGQRLGHRPPYLVDPGTDRPGGLPVRTGERGTLFPAGQDPFGHHGPCLVKLGEQHPVPCGRELRIVTIGVREGTGRAVGLTVGHN
jgi:hypothetical protein